MTAAMAARRGLGSCSDSDRDGPEDHPAVQVAGGRPGAAPGLSQMIAVYNSCPITVTPAQPGPPRRAHWQLPQQSRTVTVTGWGCHVGLATAGEPESRVRPCVLRPRRGRPGPSRRTETGSGPRRPLVLNPNFYHWHRLLSRASSVISCRPTTSKSPSTKRGT